MQHAHNDERVFLVVEDHGDHRGHLRAAAQLLSDPRIKPLVENDPKLGWPPLNHLVEEPLFARKSGSSPLQVADACAFILARSLAEASHTPQLLERIKPQLVSGFRRKFVADSYLERVS